MLVKVGELARRTGLTVRTLHHYDSIGLLRPSARSDGGYRLYSPEDVARLHGIQVLRQLGLPLDEIGTVIGEGGARLPLIIERQMSALAQQIERAGALQRRLAVLQAKFTAGQQPELADWLETLQLMAACEKHFNADEIKLIFGNWARLQTQWDALFDDVQRVIDAGTAPLDPAVQPLAQRWMDLSYLWMEGDFGLLDRWGSMYRAEAAAHALPRPGPAMLNFIDQAIQPRLAALRRHLSDDQLERLVPVPAEEWAALADAVRPLAAQRLPPDAPPVLAALKHWDALIDRCVGRDPVLRERLLHAYAVEPLLRDSAPLENAARQYLRQAAQALAAAGLIPPKTPPARRARTAA